MRASPLPLFLLGAGALLLWSRRASAAPVSTVPDVYGTGDPYIGELPPADDGELVSDPSPVVDVFPWEFDPTAPDLSWLPPATGDTMIQRQRALLYAIQRSEHFQGDVDSGMAYQTFYGGSRFTNMTDHPVATGEKRGIKLPDAWCRAAGYGPGCVSTAAGAYQLTLPTWQRERSQAPYLHDFSPQSQDAAALRLIAEKGADKLLAAGDVPGAIYRLSSIWASLPRSTSLQPQKSIDQVMAYYTEGLSLS